MASLVASPEDSTPGFEFYKCIAIVGPGVTMGVSFANGDVLEGFMNLAGTAIDAAAAIVDPIAALASSVASLLLTYFQPLTEILDWLVGNPDAVAGFAHTWRNIEKQIVTCTDDLASLGDSVLGDWTGVAANTYRDTLKAFGSVMEDVAKIAGSVGAGLKLTSDVIALVRQIVVQLVSDLVGAVISAVLEAGVTLGAGTPAIIVQLVTKITKYAKEAKVWTTGLNSTVTKIATHVDSINNILHTVVPGLKTAENKLVFISLQHLADDVYEFFDAVNETEPSAA